MYASGKVERDPVEFSDDAKARWFAQASKTEWMLRPGDYLHDITDFGSNAMEIVARLAAVMHYFGGAQGDRKSVGYGKSVSVRGDIGGRGVMNKKKITNKN